MRHAVKGRKLGRTSSHREALFRNQLQSLVEKEKIVTTLPKAKELRPIAEKVITRGKHGTVHDRRWVLRWVLKRDLVKKVFDEIAPRFSERPGGYLRIVKLGPRLGDGAEMAVLEFVDREFEGVKRRGASGVERVGPAAEVQRGRKQPCREAGDVAVQGMGQRRARRRRRDALTRCCCAGATEDSPQDWHSGPACGPRGRRKPAAVTQAGYAYWQLRDTRTASKTPGTGTDLGAMSLPLQRVSPHAG